MSNGKEFFLSDVLAVYHECVADYYRKKADLHLSDLGLLGIANAGAEMLGFCDYEQYQKDLERFLQCEVIECAEILGGGFDIEFDPSVDFLPFLYFLLFNHLECQIGKVSIFKTPDIYVSLNLNLGRGDSHISVSSASGLLLEEKYKEHVMPLQEMIWNIETIDLKKYILFEPNYDPFAGLNVLGLWDKEETLKLKERFGSRKK